MLGILDLRGAVIPVMDVRKRFRLPSRELRPADQFIIARAGNLTVALAVDAAHEVVEVQDADLIDPDAIQGDLEYVTGVTRTKDGLVLIHDLDTFLSPAEEKVLVSALERDDA